MAQKLYYSNSEKDRKFVRSQSRLDKVLLGRNSKMPGFKGYKKSYGARSKRLMATRTKKSGLQMRFVQGFKRTGGIRARSVRSPVFKAGTRLGQGGVGAQMRRSKRQINARSKSARGASSSSRGSSSSTS